MKDKEISKYILVEKKGASILSDAVNMLLASGWQPFGSPFSIGSAGNWFAQAMVKNEGFDKPKI